MEPFLSQQVPENKSQADESLLLANERTRLAAERTFLAWIRTGLTSIAGGLAVARLIVFKTLEHEQIAHWIGQLLVLWGISTFILALLSYNHSCRKLEQATDYRHDFWKLSILIMTLVILSLGLFWIIR